MVGRPKAENPRSRLIGVRVTSNQGDVLDALAALDKSTVSEVARQSLLRTISAAMQDEHVRDMVELQRRHARRADADVLPLTSRPPKDARG
jgi:hypothetical protein